MPPAGQTQTATAPGGIVQFSSDPEFAPKVRDIVGLYMNPPDEAIVLSVEEKSQIQALDRTQPILPLRPGMPGAANTRLRMSAEAPAPGVPEFSGSDRPVSRC
jgi:hypothetical protein